MNSVFDKVMRYLLIGAVAAVAILAFNVLALRGSLDTARNDLAAANARVALMQSEVTSCKGTVINQNEQIQAYKLQAEAASKAADEAATAAMKLPRKKLEGHGPEAMNSWLSGLQ
jgi:hypothetical protein